VTNHPASERERFVTTSGGIELCFRTDGDPTGQPMVLIAGLGQQLISWPQDFVDTLVTRGFYVIRHDNRDIGRSSRISHVRPPSLWRQTTRRFVAEQYTLGDMAEDTVAVLDAVGVGSVDVVGMSMGGMIAQTVAARHPERTRSLTSIFSNTGHLRNGWVAPRVLLTFARSPDREREASAVSTVAMFKLIGSAGYPFDEDEMRQLALDQYDRGDGATAYRGTARQVGAIYKSGNRTRELGGITAPTLVIHGDRDLMVHPSGGRATAAAIPGARLVTITGMGHELPRGARPEILDLITEHARTAVSAAHS
jgi:pimeloyl-ACP methyl ester carboxylesterase